MDALAHSPVDGARKDGGVVVVHAEDEARVDHDAEVVEAADRGLVPRPRSAASLPAAEVLQLALGAQVVVAQRLEADEQAAAAGRDGLLEEAGLQHRLYRGGGLPDAAHAAHAGEEGARELRAAEEVVVQEVEVTTRQSLDLGQGVVERLQVERAAAREERLLVAEVAEVRAAARHDERVGHQVEPALDEVASRRRHALEGALVRPVDAARAAGAVVGQKSGPGVLAGAQEHRVGVLHRLVGERGRVQAAEADVGAPGAVPAGDVVGAGGRGDVGLDHHEVGLVVERHVLDVLVADLDVVVGVEIAGELGEAQGRKQRVLDRPPEGTVARGLARQDHLDLHGVSFGRG